MAPEWRPFCASTLERMPSHGVPPAVATQVADADGVALHRVRGVGAIGIIRRGRILWYFIVRCVLRCPHEKHLSTIMRGGASCYAQPTATATAFTWLQRVFTGRKVGAATVLEVARLNPRVLPLPHIVLPCVRSSRCLPSCVSELLCLWSVVWRPGSHHIGVTLACAIQEGGCAAFCFSVLISGLTVSSIGKKMPQHDFISRHMHDP